MTSGPSEKGPNMNRVSSMLVVSSPLPAMDVLPGKAQHRRNTDRKQTLLTCGLKQQQQQTNQKTPKPWWVTDTIQEELKSQAIVQSAYAASKPGGSWDILLTVAQRASADQTLLEEHKAGNSERLMET